ncbi:hypothetical protein [Massilia sp. TS11]|uniref:hypothetical protein n=1 Tax=Massilia sp. TS11 TaxID=2908003 RepID=UPI001EDB509B|nr:hypothetical protein [Massilia sp. TS11]MCG2583810.1 hypothetical protein [Massilia sp. TS11]
MTPHGPLSDHDLEKIIDAATIYLCACPAQVAEQILRLRQLLRYQQNCLQQKDTDTEVHQTIGRATERALAIMDECIDQVLSLEKWDRNTLTMPEGLRARRDAQLPT